jgi:Zn-finger nucleic acid-binding protein
MYRDSFEKCPRCAVELVDARSARGCRACGGYWVEEPVLTEMVLAMLPPRPLSRLALAVLDRSEAPIGCPTCGDAMQSTSIHEVILDRCVKHGIWFDARELEDALRKVADPDRAPPLEEIPALPARLARRSPAVLPAVPWPVAPSAPAAPSPPPSGDVVLVFQVHAPGQPPRELRVQQSILKLGRLPRSHVHLDDAQVSRIHAVIEATSVDNVIVIDLGSTAGTQVNGKPIQKHRLRTGDTLQLGDTSLHVTIAPAPSRALPR